MVATGSKLVISARDIPIGVRCHRSREPESHEVHSVAHRIVIALERCERLQIRNHDTGTDSNALWIHLLNLRWSQTKISRGNIVSCAKSLHTSSGTSRGIETPIGMSLANVLNHAILHSGAGHDSHHALCFPLAVTFIVHKKEKTVFLDRPGKVRAKVVSD